MRRAVTRTARATLTGATRLLNFHKRHPPAGAPPGTLVFPEERTPAIVRITVYGPEGVMERDDVPLEELPALILPDRVMWIDVQGLGGRGGAPPAGRDLRHPSAGHGGRGQRPAAAQGRGL